MERVDIENNIIKILNNIRHPSVEVIKNNLSFFDINDLYKINSYLENWNLNHLEKLLIDKKNEYLNLLNKIKITQDSIKLSQIKIKERLELENEQKNIEKIDFDF